MTDTSELRQSVRRFVDDVVAPMLAKAERAGEMSREVLDAIAGQGFTGMRIAPEWGGQGLPFAEYCAVLEEFARLGPSLHFWLVDSLGITLERLGSPKQKDEYLRPYAAWKKTGSLCFSEPDAGSDAGAIRTRAVRRDAGWVITGRKHYISRGDTADFYFVTAVTDKALGPRGGITTFLVDRGTPGLSVPRVDVSMGSSLHRLAEVVFDDCFVPDDAVIGEVGFGFLAAMKTLDDGRLSVASTCLGTAQRLVELMVEHAKERHTFGHPLSDRQGIRWMIADSVTDIELGRALLTASMAKLEAGEPLGVRASICKLHMSEALGRIADRAVQVHGGAGLLRGQVVEQLYRDVRFFRIGEGTSEVQRMLIARSVLGRPSRDGD
ncbi:MAG: acyl-CoA dehydrogenase family protein [Lautropia sp.]